MKKKTKFRKKQDAKWAMFYNRMDIFYQYVTDPIKISDDIQLLPDFWLLDHNCYIIIRKELFITKNDKITAYCLAKATNRVVITFSDLTTAPATGDDTGLFNYGSYMTPEGDRDGLIMWGSCPGCGSKHLGHLGSAELCDSKHRIISPQNCPSCTGGGVTVDILEAYDHAASFF